MGLSYDDILTTWREADALPVFEHAWLWAHMVPLRGDVRAAALEAWTLLSALAAQTTRLRLGIMVTSNRLRFPTLLAKMAATVDTISGGRLIFGRGSDHHAADMDRRGAVRLRRPLLHAAGCHSTAPSWAETPPISSGPPRTALLCANSAGSAQLIIRSADAAEARSAVLSFVEAGASHLVLAGPLAPLPAGQTSVRWLAQEVVEPVLGHVG